MTIQDINQRVDHISKFHDRYLLTFFSCDPRQALKNSKAKGLVETLVSYEEVAELSQFAVELHLQHLTESSHRQP